MCHSIFSKKFRHTHITKFMKELLCQWLSLKLLVSVEPQIHSHQFCINSSNFNQFHVKTCENQKNFYEVNLAISSKIFTAIYQLNFFFQYRNAYMTSEKGFFTSHAI